VRCRGCAASAARNRCFENWLPAETLEELREAEEWRRGEVLPNLGAFWRVTASLTIFDRSVAACRAAPLDADLPLRRGRFDCPLVRGTFLVGYIIHAANAMSAELARVTDHSIASRPKKRLASISFCPCVFTPS
jgi:hypothetical protein